MGEVAQHLERRRAGADDHGGLQHGRRSPGGHQQLADLDPRREVLAELDVVRVQARHVDDPADPTLVGHPAERRGKVAVTLDEPGASVHRVQQVVGHVDSGPFFLRSPVASAGC